MGPAMALAAASLGAALIWARKIPPGDGVLG
jgi:hypothetical protein